jgi:hypothetical protein
MVQNSKIVKFNDSSTNKKQIFSQSGFTLSKVEKNLQNSMVPPQIKNKSFLNQVVLSKVEISIKKKAQTSKNIIFHT